MIIARLIAIAMLVAVATAHAAVRPGDAYEITWFTIDAGGGPSDDGAVVYRIDGTIGQPDAGPVMTGGPFAVAGGYWARTPCPGDIDGDGLVAIDDLLLILGTWGPCSGCPADIDADGNVDVDDLLVVLGGWGPCP